jgi:hypothetical protein
MTRGFLGLVMTTEHNLTERSSEEQDHPSREPTGEDEDPSPAAPNEEEWRQVWSIGIYTGDSPLRLSPPPEIRNPVLTYKHISDISAEFVADPFMVVEKGAWYMFFEVMNRATENGEIGLAVSNDGLHWEYSQIVFKEPFHVSYPCVFEWEDEYYMIPETLAADAIRLYRAVSFPTEWSYVGDLISGRYADSSIFRFDGQWWMLTCPYPARDEPGRHNSLRLFHADQLTAQWREHPRSPMVEDNPHIARPGGRVTAWNGRLVRFTQDCVPCYGTQVRAFEITELTPTSYREEEVSESPVLSAGGEKWNGSGMHHVDPWLTPQGTWIACVDGWWMERKIDSP